MHYTPAFMLQHSDKKCLSVVNFPILFSSIDYEKYANHRCLHFLKI